MGTDWSPTKSCPPEGWSSRSSLTVTAMGLFDVMVLPTKWLEGCRPAAAQQ